MSEVMLTIHKILAHIHQHLQGQLNELMVELKPYNLRTMIPTRVVCMQHIQEKIPYKDLKYHATFDH